MVGGNVNLAIPEEKSDIKSKHEKKQAVLTNTGTKKQQYKVCKDDRYEISECKEFIDKNNDDRWQFIKVNRFCYCILESGHSIRRRRCRKRKKMRNAIKYNIPLLYLVYMHWIDNMTLPTIVQAIDAEELERNYP